MQDKSKKLRNEKGKPAGNVPEIGSVRVFSNPGPDAGDRLRRLLSLMVRHATRDGTTAPDQASPVENENQAEEK